MTDRTRRRLRIAALLLIVIVALGWLLSPGVDRRLVGEWVNAEPGAFAAYRRFRADGTHTLSADFPEGGYWSVSGDTLIFTGHWHTIGLTGSLRRVVYEVINRFREGGPVTERYQILEVTPSTLRIQSDAGLAPVESYRRKPAADDSQ